MSRAFAEFTFTDSVKAAQTRYGSRTAVRGIEFADDPRSELTSSEIAFIEARDSFYQATVAETGWPYVQHRGGPVGFLKVLDVKTLAYADFRGNLQYLSVGNLAANDRVALILMDYANRRRLKIWGHVSIIDASADPVLLEKLVKPDYRAQVERAMVIKIAALDWNCPQHIRQRFTAADLESVIGPLKAENERLKALLAEYQAREEQKKSETN